LQVNPQLLNDRLTPVSGNCSIYLIKKLKFEKELICPDYSLFKTDPYLNYCKAPDMGTSLILI
jgi:hypothetical protein